GILVEEGKLNWDDKVSKYLPEFELYDPFIERELTIRDLISHRSGYNTFDGDLLWYGTSYSREEILERFRHMKNKSSFRSGYGYQNIMFIAAGEVVEAVSGQTWDKFVQERIFKPLDMNDSYTSINDFPKDLNLAMPHLHGKQAELINYDNSGAAAAINSNVEDLSHWLQMWLNKGSYNGKQILKQQTVETILSPNTLIDLSAYDRKRGTHFSAYGMGWFLFDYHGKLVAHHGGGLPGYISKIAFVPEENLGLVVLTNGESYLPSALMYQLIDMMLDKPNQDWAGQYLKLQQANEAQKQKAKQERAAKRATGTKPSVALEKYTGTYEDKMYGKAEVSLQNNQLQFKMLPTQKLFTGQLEHWHHNTFKIELADKFLPEGFVTFNLNSNGEVTGFTIDLPNPDFHFYNLKFEKVKQQ
ncbi:MAG: serine hydrolase, partial [Hymenobacteraceae bacterium]|nr:serine hydrolase [Hymenobacteraceae bacterium]MDX5397302.1 serine hydrolase [Hymenobacteraceae bacterium]MDX5513380.1 serine hydrolase [Hymenobacteraceae bacterium]